MDALLCNPLPVPYPYQFVAEADGRALAFREAADPSLVAFAGRFWLFASKTGSVWVSDDLARWEAHPLPAALPLEGYAPDVCAAGGFLWFCAFSQHGEPGAFFRTRDPIRGPWEKIESSFPFADPCLFADDDGRLYFYNGCSDREPVRGVELDPATMRPCGPFADLVAAEPDRIGLHRLGEGFAGAPDARPWIEGAWMTKRGGLYHLQIACPGTECNTYSDLVYVSEAPLGPFRLAPENPFSHKPGGFLPGAGHGSTLVRPDGRAWHAATMRLSVAHPFERRVGLWPCSFGPGGALVCDQRFGDWPRRADDPPWSDPPWMLLSVGKRATASSAAPGCGPERAVEEDARTWWRAAAPGRGEWLQVDLGATCDVAAVQVNFADDAPAVPAPAGLRPGERRVDPDAAARRTQWLLEASEDGDAWRTLADRRNSATDLPHELVAPARPVPARFLRLSGMALPFGAAPCVSGLRAFGRGRGAPPVPPRFTVRRLGPLDLEVAPAPQPDALGFLVEWGETPGFLPHGDLVFAPGPRRLGALVRGRPGFVRVAAFNENGVARGETVGFI